MAKPTFRANPIQIHVPATSANLGPGFDCLGLALGLHDRYIAQVIDEAKLDIDIAGEGADSGHRLEQLSVDLFLLEPWFYQVMNAWSMKSY